MALFLFADEFASVLKCSWTNRRLPTTINSIICTMMAVYGCSDTDDLFCCAERRTAREICEMLMFAKFREWFAECKCECINCPCWYHSKRRPFIVTMRCDAMIRMPKQLTKFFPIACECWLLCYCCCYFCWLHCRICFNENSKSTNNILINPDIVVVLHAIRIYSIWKNAREIESEKDRKRERETLCRHGSKQWNRYERAEICKITHCNPLTATEIHERMVIFILYTSNKYIAVRIYLYRTKQ